MFLAHPCLRIAGLIVGLVVGQRTDTNVLSVKKIIVAMEAMGCEFFDKKDMVRRVSPPRPLLDGCMAKWSHELLTFE